MQQKKSSEDVSLPAGSLILKQETSNTDVKSILSLNNS
jgi:hypothetical protein